MLGFCERLAQNTVPCCELTTKIDMKKPYEAIMAMGKHPFSWITSPAINLSLWGFPSQRLMPHEGRYRRSTSISLATSTHSVGKDSFQTWGIGCTWGMLHFWYLQIIDDFPDFPIQTDINTYQSILYKAIIKTSMAGYR